MNGHAKVQSEHQFDVIVVGAGISGINAAYRVQDELPGLSYAILEARHDLGGTWDLFKYPGIRSDSDLFTFGFAFNPWSRNNPIAEGAAIKSYIADTAQKFGIDQHILYKHRLTAADWSTQDHVWNLVVDADGKERKYTARFVIFGTGYYNYSQPLDVQIPGIEKFNGQVIHPQFWPEDLDYKDKKVVVIGSGATAITLIPNLADKAARVTMLQRSPTYILSLPNRSSKWLSYVLPTATFHRVQRAIAIITTRIFFLFCQKYPNFSRWILKKSVCSQLPDHIPYEPHFAPRYNPWDQRLCVCPDGDFFKSLRAGKADVRTDTIKTVTSNGIALNSGETLDADIIVTATGLKLQLAGGAQISVDGEKYDPGSKYMWNGVMLQDLPNASFIIGYTNASWTLGSDATAQFVTRLLKFLEKRKLIAATPRLKSDEAKNLEERPLLNLSSTYITVASRTLPRAGDKGPWQPRDHYHKDIKFALKGDLSEGMEFVAGPSLQLRPDMN
ncbi:FAD-containing monooxygenase EthA [Penicillium diatomitis]|uniref:FAD-containing monooxygenase EthA n=1 Tax=Penicillium diatomitis TaxID=2819901 RepID=A0A9W9XDY4_9EURO|nr:FAD-containing monooxygenase EthA [Penicillium diatomitis]KAJ5489529.1 FAD-containing monooxygenase EthA [Penicillium diatomitis]